MSVREPWFAAPRVNARERRNAFDRSECGNGPDEYGEWPCDPRVVFGASLAECQSCGRVAPWIEKETSDA